MTEEETEYNDTDYGDQLCRKDEVVELGSIIIPVIFSLVVVLSCIGNILVLVILALLLFTFGLPFWASYFVWGWTFGEIGCKAVKFLFYVGFYSSVLFLTLMTIQRYMAVVHPLSDWEKCRGGSFNSTVIPHLNSTYCEYGSVEIKSGIAYFQNAFFFFAFLIMGFCYGRMLQTITKSRTNKRHKTVRLIFCIALVFFIGWAPYNIVMFLKSLTDQNIHPFTGCTVSTRLDYAYHACRMLAFTHCCLNPVFYVFIGVKFRNHLKLILQKIFKKKKKLDFSQARLAKNVSQGSMY